MAQRTQYANAILPTYRPSDVHEVIKARLASGEHLNSGVADWFRERARIEGTYAAELDKLTRKVIPELHRSGLFEATWTTIIRSTHETADASNAFAHKIQHDVEHPLRRFCVKSPQWADMKVLHGELETLGQLFKNSESGNKKRHGDSPEEVRQQWENQAPYILEQVETIDESRLGHLKNLLTTFGTLEADRSEKTLKISEKVLNNILSYEPIDDVAAFAALVGKGDGLPQPAHSIHSSSRQEHPGSGPDALGQTITNQSDGLYENPGAPREDASSSSKLRSKVGSIFRSSKKKNKHVPMAPIPSASSISSPAARYRNGTSTPSRGPISEHDSPSSAVAPISASQRKPPPPPARKANGGPQPSHSSFDGPTSPVTLSAPPRNVAALIEEPEEKEIDVPATVPEEEDRTLRPFKIDIKQDAINEKRDDDDVALSVIASTLRQRNTVSGRGQRGRRDIQSTLFTNIPPSTFEPQSPTGPVGTIAEEAPVLPPLQTHSSIPLGNITEPHEAISSPTGGDTQSIFSQQSTAAVVSNVAGGNLVHPPFPAELGLHASVVEVLSAFVTDGTVTRSQLIGEIAFSYNGPAAEVDVRVGNLGIFESLTPNGAFVRAINDSTYALSARALNGGNAAAGFGFVSNSAAAFVPVDFSPIWRIENNQSSLMLAYKVANSYLRESPVVLHDLTITVPIEGGIATSAVSKPHALFNKVKQRIVWKFNDPVIVKAGFEDRLLCRFTTDGPARESAKGIEIKFRLVTSGNKTLPVDHDVSGDESAGHQVVLDYSEGGESYTPVNTVVSLISGQFSVHSEQHVQNNM